MSKLKRELGSRVGIHIDIETLIKKKSVIRLAKSKKIKLVTYSLNGDKAHARGLSKIYKRSKWKPHAIIIDKKISKVCGVY